MPRFPSPLIDRMQRADFPHYALVAVVAAPTGQRPAADHELNNDCSLDSPIIAVGDGAPTRRGPMTKVALPGSAWG
jgi:hypothetical protein